MKHIKEMIDFNDIDIEESAINISGKFPTFGDTHDDINPILYNMPDYFVVYRKSEKYVESNLLNRWFINEVTHKGMPGESIYRVLITVKMFDRESMVDLYEWQYNCISFKYMNSELDMSIHSIDGNNYTAHFDDSTDNEYVKEQLVRWVDKKYTINGNDLLYYCRQLGSKNITRMFH